MENKVIQKVELRNKSFVIFFTDGTRFDFCVESMDGKNVYSEIAVAKFNHKIIWTSQDYKKKKE